jgi:hypothetical protein
MNERNVPTETIPNEDESRISRRLLRGIGRISIRKPNTEVFADELVVTEGAKLRPIEDFVGVVKNAPVRLAALRQLKDERRARQLSESE